MRTFAIIVGVITVAVAVLMIKGGPGASGPAAEDAPPGAVVLSAVPRCVPDHKTLPAPLPRAQLEAEILGKSTYETCFRIGAPRSSSKSGDTEYWYYGGITMDDRSGRPDNSIQVIFEDGVVARVNF